MTSLAEIYDWFMTGKKPTQPQFWASWGSFWHKDEAIPQSSVSGLTNVLNAKVENDQFNAHKVANDAHAGLFQTKEDKAQKGAPNGYAPLDEFTKLASQYLNIVNDLVTGGATALLSAEQGKVLQTQVSAINTLLTSDNLNLDTVQELVDAIETVQLSLSTILVNDLTTGGTTKALTAEMGKALKGLLDTLTTSVNGKISTVVMTVKTILSTALATQDITGFVNYINTLAAPLVVGANEMVEYKTSDTGRVFKLLLRGRSFGVGQPAITAADVIETTEFLNKDIRLGNYPSTRNDGQLPTNKVLAPDVNGNLKLYTIATAPAPYMEVLIPDSTLPSTTTNFTIKGAFFTPTMTVSIVGQTINYITFVSDNLIKVNVTTGAAEGSYAVTLNNGLAVTYNNALLIVLGTIYSPLTADWEAPTGSVSAIDDSVKVNTYEVVGSNRWNKQFDYTRNFRVQFKVAKTPFGNTANNEYQFPHVILKKASDNSTLFALNVRKEAAGFVTIFSYSVLSGWTANIGTYGGIDAACAVVYEFRYISGTMYIYMDGVLRKTFSDSVTGNLKLTISTKTLDFIGIKYIETA
ncbi:IPT/TIG domain-containing protein [Flavobacterium sp.]|uniref:IPT/TIG domain-containing protein n=1 Tax=Flavobacterium sp. TaxID=239 RepID=UPI00261E544C|nr:IPT/TIG domain-containing protein [Flavobacterium sp.]